MVVLYLLLLSWLLLELLLLELVLETWLGCLNLCSHWLSAQFGNWQWCKAVLMCSSSLSNESYVEETVFALCARVLYTLCLAVMWWLLSQCRYWSVCVGFLSTGLHIFPSYFSLILSTMVSTCVHLPTPPSLYLHVDLQQHHLVKVLYNILLD